MNKKAIFVLLFALCTVIALSVIEHLFGDNYSFAVKTAAKVALFLVVPGLIYLFLMRKRVRTAIALPKVTLKSLLPGLIIGIGSFIVVLGTYFILQNFIDLQAIADDLKNRLGITPLNFILVALYVTFVNSLLEELFFRGFIFLNLYKNGPKWFAYVFSAGLFALYHIPMINQWFSSGLLLLAMLGLFIIGLVYNYLNVRSGHFLNSWLAHALADSAIILIGLRMFGML